MIFLTLLKFEKIWDIGNKIISVLMKFTIENNSTYATEKIYYILQYIQLKSTTLDKLSKNNEKEISQASKFLIRHIWSNMLESLR